MRKIDRNPFPFAIWPDAMLAKAGERINDPESVEKTKALVNALASQDEEFMPLSREWNLGDDAFASRIGDHGAYAGRFQPDTGELYIDWLGMNPEGTLNDPETRNALYGQWHKMGVRKIGYEPETDLDTPQVIPHTQWGRLAETGDLEQRNQALMTRIPKRVRGDWAPTEDPGKFTAMRNGQIVHGTWRDILDEGKKLGARVRSKLFDGLINGYENYANQNGGFLPTPSPVSTPVQADDAKKFVNIDDTRRTPKPMKTVRPWTPVEPPEIHPDFYPYLHDRYGIRTHTPTPSASEMTMRTPEPTPMRTPVKPVVPPTMSQPTPTPTPTPERTPVQPVVPPTASDPIPSPTPKSEGFTAPKITVPKPMLASSNWFNFSLPRP
ncbi:MAG: hypothetical protein EBR94_08740 [Bacteroidetes bacterium]|nr:hypothetical protein [Bacteroidota bacterium]